MFPASRRQASLSCLSLCCTCTHHAGDFRGGTLCRSYVGRRQVVQRCEQGTMLQQRLPLHQHCSQSVARAVHNFVASVVFTISTLHSVAYSLVSGATGASGFLNRLPKSSRQTAASTSCIRCGDVVPSSSSSSGTVSECCNCSTVDQQHHPKTCCGIAYSC